MNWSVVADVVNAAAVTIGVVFAASQLFDIRKQRKRDAMLALVRSFQSGDFNDSTTPHQFPAGWCGPRRDPSDAGPRRRGPGVHDRAHL